MSAFTPGLKLHDRYLLEQRIGVGGMAEVWRAHDLVLGRAVAIKVLAGQIAADPVLRAGAQREARAAAALSHPNITAVHDYGEAVFGDQHVEPYLVMELLTGHTLADRLAGGPLSWPETARIGAQIASALAAAHAQGVVHRDIKPANIMLTATGVKVLDFGIAALIGQVDPSSGWLVGTPAYTAPERLRDSAPHPSADVYALGVLLAEAATGVRPVPIDSWQQAAQLPAGGWPDPDLSRLPASAAGLVRACLDPVPQRRPNAGNLARSLSGRGAHLAPATPTGPSATLVTPSGGFVAGAAAVPSPPTRVYQAESLGTAKAPPARSRFSIAAIALIAVVGVVSIALIGVAALRPSGDGNTANPGAGSTSTRPADPTGEPDVEPTTDLVDAAVLLGQLREAIAQGVADGEIRPKRVNDLRRKLSDLNERWQDQRWEEVVKKAQDLKQDLDDWARKREVSQQFATQFSGLLDQVIEAAEQNDGNSDDDDSDG